MDTKKAISRLDTAIELLNAVASSLPIDDSIRKQLILKQQDLEDIQADLEERP